MVSIAEGRTALLVAVLLAFTGVTAGALPAAAQSGSDDGLLSGLDDIEDREGDGWAVDDGLSAAKSGVAGWMERTQYGISRSGYNPFSSGPENTAQEEATEVRHHLNNNSEAYENASWIQSRVDATQDIERVQVTLHIQEETGTLYLLGNASSGNYTDIRAVENLSDGEYPDAEIHLCGMAAENASEELETFTEKYAAPDEKPSQQYYAKMGGKYKKDVEDRYGNLFDSEGDCL